MSDLRRAHEATENQLSRHMAARSVAISVLDETHLRIASGSGFCALIAGHFLVGTAAHIAHHYPDRLIFLLTDGTPSNGVLKIVNSASDVGVAVFSKTDLGWFELSPAAARASGRIFMTLEEMHHGAASFPDRIVHTVGAPGAMVQDGLEYREQRSERFAMVPYFTATLASPDAAHNDPAFDTFLDYSSFVRQGEAPSTVVPDARGMSGAGVWISAPYEPGALWTPAPRLVGVVRSTLSSRWIRATQIQHWLRMIARDIPDTAEDIAGALSGRLQVGARGTRPR